jgi:iron complex transport system substrate-binding protein
MRILAAGGLALALAGCGAPPDSPPGGTRHTRTDDAGRVFDLSTPPARVISLVPSATEMIVALGAADRLVARTRYDQAPELAHLPSLGGGLDPNLEAVMALRPDLVVVTPDSDLRATVRRLEALGIPVFSGRSGTVEDLRRLAENLGAVLGGESMARADAFLDSLRVGLAALERRADTLPRPSVLYLVWHDPPMAAGPGSYLDDLVRAAGGRSTFDDQPTAWPTVSVEEILRRDPDWVVLAEGDAAAGERLRWIQAAPGWRDLRAVREGRVAVVEADLFNRPGPRILEAARTLAGILHP